MGLKDRAGSAYHRARALGAEVTQSDALQDVNTEKLIAAAADASGIKKGNGKINKWRVVRAASNPANTARKIATAVGKEAYQQHKNSTSETTGEAPPTTDPLPQ